MDRSSDSLLSVKLPQTTVYAFNEPDPDSFITAKSPGTTVYIFNMSEDVWPFIHAITNDSERQKEIEENANLGDRDIFSSADEDNIIYILPKKIPDIFSSYYIDLLGKKNIRFVIPKHHTGQICEDILRDEDVMNIIIDAANGAKRLTIASYTTSPELLNLIRVLQEKGLTVFTPESPEEEDAWTVNFYGSKSGIRQLAQQSRVMEPDFIMPDGVICMGIVDAAKIAAKKYIKEHGVVLKTNKGHSGAGILIFREGDLPTEYAACDTAIVSALKKDAYWKKFPIVIESLISVNPTIGGGFPNVEFRILKNGHVEFLYYCGMLIDKNGVFKGVEIHNEVVSHQVAARMVDTGFYIGEQYRAAGYRGYFDVDFVAAKNGQIYVTESNVRRTGGTHVYAVAEHFFGKDFMYATYIISNNSYQLPKEKKFPVEKLFELLQPLLFNKKTREGIVVVSANLLDQHQFAYIVFGMNKRRAHEIESEMEKALAL